MPPLGWVVVRTGRLDVLARHEVEAVALQGHGEHGLDLHHGEGRTDARSADRPRKGMYEYGVMGSPCRGRSGRGGRLGVTPVGWHAVGDEGGVDNEVARADGVALPLERRAGHAVDAGGGG